MPIFSSTCDNFTGFVGSAPSSSGQPGTSMVSDPSAGRTGNGFLATLVTGSYEMAARSDYRSLNVKEYTFDIRIPAATVISASGNGTLIHAWDDAYADLLEVRLQSVNAQANYQLFFVTNFITYAAEFTVPDWLAKDTWYTITIQITNTHIICRINGRLAARYATASMSGKSLGVVDIGAFYGCVLAGTMHIDNILQDVSTTPSQVSGDANKLAAVWSQYKINHLRADGCPIRSYPDGLNGSFQPWSDTTSETVSYLMLMAVQLNDQTTFNSVANWAYNNMRRGAQALGTVPYLYSWHWNITNNTAYDQNSAHDADFDILNAYYWAHGRWGSAGAINYLSRGNNIANDLIGQAYTNGSLKYIPSDYVQGVSSPFEVNPSYYSPVAMELAKLYNTANSSAWNQAINGTYDLLQRARDFIYSPQTVSAGYPPNWGSFNPTTQAWAAGGRPNPDLYAYEAFRSMWRIKLHHLMYAASAASALYATAKTNLITYWNANSAIAAEYKHDGSVNGSAYEASIFTYAAWQCLTINDSGNSIAATIFSNKLSNIYTTTVEGHIYQNAPSSNNYSYYDQSWLILGELQRIGMTNFLESIVPTPKKGKSKLRIGIGLGL